jgi:hypothetical protein
MKRWVILSALLVAAFAFVAVGAAKPPKPPKPPKQPHPNKATTTIQTTDHGCSGALWATDTITRTVKVHRNKDGSYRIREKDKGTFTTTGGVSPGNCPANTSKHGTAVLPAVTGKLKGSIKGTVTNGTFNPSATCAAVPCTQALFIAAFFGAGAQFSCLSASSTDCRFDYKYKAHDQNLRFHKWRDSGHGAGAQLKERFKGDIANT